MAFLARYYEIAGIGGSQGGAHEAQAAHDLIYNDAYSFDRAFLFRPRPTDWQRGYADIAIGDSGVDSRDSAQTDSGTGSGIEMGADANTDVERRDHTQYSFLEELEQLPDGHTMCFEKAVLPGASLYVYSSNYLAFYLAQQV